MHNVNGIDYHRANPNDNTSVRAVVFNLGDGNAALALTIQTDLGNFLVPLGADTGRVLLGDLSGALP